ncbi:MAG: LysR substrate-binding domain-containing protein, partial [Phenylobacterium sp.]
RARPGRSGGGRHVTASAVSHHVRAVEEWLNTTLFVRSTRQVRLTEAGRRLSDRLNLAFSELNRALHEARGETGPAVIRVSALPLFTSAYLIPRLARFEARFPEVSIEIETSHRVVDFDSDAVDVAIRNIALPTPGLTSHKLMDLRTVPLCAPALAAELQTPADLERATLIHIASRPRGWASWMAAQGLEGLEGRASVMVDTLPAALDLAAHGRGVALGMTPIVWDAPQMERLVVPFSSVPVSAGAYFLVHRRQDRTHETIQAFVRWLRQEVRTDAARFARQGAAAR